jgi:hypothetical protein
VFPRIFERQACPAGDCRELIRVPALAKAGSHLQVEQTQVNPEREDSMDEQNKDDQNTPPTLVSRRTFVGSVAAAAGVMIVPRRVLGGPLYQAPSDRVNIATVGYAHGMGTSNTKACVKAGANIVALCDVDESAAAGRATERSGILQDVPNAARYTDFRVMLEKQKDIDAVIVATPDHSHAVIAMAAMQLGKHVYVQKPLTRTVSEARALTEAARRYKVVTQMGNQGHSGEGFADQEWIIDRAIGKVRRCYWTNARYGRRNEAAGRTAVRGLDWDPGSGRHRRVHAISLSSFSWRVCDFGAGALGDMGCRRWARSHRLEAGVSDERHGRHRVSGGGSAGGRDGEREARIPGQLPAGHDRALHVPGSRQEVPGGEAALVRRRAASGAPGGAGAAADVT